jgi:hypothetical protein
MRTQIIQSGPGGRRSGRGIAAWIRRHRLISFIVLASLLATAVLLGALVAG